MTPYPHIFAALLVCLALLAPGRALAQDTAEEPSKGPRPYVALGLGLAPDYLGSSDYAPIPLVVAELPTQYAIFSLRGLTLSADVLAPRTDGSVTGGLMVNYRGGREDVENERVDDLPDLDASVELGAFLGYRFQNLGRPGDALTFAVEGLADVSGGHEGFLVSPSVSYGRPLTERLYANLSLGFEYGDASFADAYFSVSPQGAADSGLDVYEADAGIYAVGGSLLLSYALTEHFGLMGLFAYNRLTGDAADSPVVDDEGDPNQFLGAFGVSYSF